MAWGLQGNLRGPMGPGLQQVGRSSDHTLDTSVDNTSFNTSMSVTLTEIGTYYFYARGFFTRSGTAGAFRGARFAPNFTGTSTGVRYSNIGHILAAANTNFVIGTTTWEDTSGTRTFTDSQTLEVTVEGWFTASTTGSLQIRIAKHSSTLTDHSITLLAGSYLYVVKVS